jgi:hypothetical protein
MAGAQQHQVLMPMFVLAGWLFHNFIGYAMLVGLAEKLETANYWYFIFAMIFSIGFGVLYDNNI